MFFSKAEYEERYLPFVYDDNPEDYNGDVDIISIEAYGSVTGETKYCYASYVVKNDFNELRNLIKDTYLKTIKVTFKIKKNKVKNFKIDLQSLANAYSDQRFADMELLCWGLNDRSFKELNANNL